MLKERTASIPNGEIGKIGEVLSKPNMFVTEVLWAIQQKEKK